MGYGCHVVRAGVTEDLPTAPERQKNTQSSPVQARFILSANAKRTLVTQQSVRTPFPLCDAMKFASHEAFAGCMNRASVVVILG